MHRLFVALRPPAALREHLLATMQGVPGARWQSDEQLHCTLRFVGEVDRRQGEDVAEALAGIVAPRVAIALAGIGRFERRGRIDALWAGVAPYDPLAALHRKIDRALVRAGLPYEKRAYLPHITLARFSRGSHAAVEGYLAANAGLTSAAHDIAAFGLYESMLAADGAVYHLVERYSLGAVVAC